MANPATRRNLLGIACLCTGVAVFSTHDAIIKGISGDYAVTQAMVTRSLVALPILAVFVQWGGGLRQLLSPRFWMLTLRGLILLLAYTTYYIAFPALPLADAIALFFTAPLMITFLAVPILHERVAAKEWIAAGIGFAGVLVMLRPGGGLFEPAALLSLASAFFYAISAIVARKLGVEEKASVMAFYQNIVFLIGAGAMAFAFAGLGIEKAAHPSLEFLVRPWAWPKLQDFMLMGACGVIAAVAMSLLTNAYRMAPASLVSVFEYTGMLWTPLWGFFFFAEIPTWGTVIGALLIAAAGILAILAPGRQRGG
ncbi:MAG: DMT family transporter [Rhizobiales bacterium]|nr:DMT family transporter [Hyphomicrobiales bacterium]